MQELAAASKLLTRHEAAEHLTVSLRVLDELAAKRKIRAVKIGRSVRYRMQALEDFIKASEQ
jgi:excisionase family DNA binding protein